MGREVLISVIKGLQPVEKAPFGAGDDMYNAAPSGLAVERDSSIAAGDPIT
jgi:hypothetical protein